MLAKTFSVISILAALVACDNMPKVTLNQLDITHNKVNPFKITKIDKKECKIEVEEQPSFQLLGPDIPKNPDGSIVMQGSFALTKEDFAKYEAYLQAECKSNNEIQRLKEENESLKNELNRIREELNVKSTHDHG